jgi:hypothetical protein
MCVWISHGRINTGSVLKIEYSNFLMMTSLRMMNPSSHSRSCIRMELIRNRVWGRVPQPSGCEGPSEHHGRGIWLAERLSASQDRFCSITLIILS